MDGNIHISTSYEGIEGLTVVISGGTVDLVASYDGINAAGGVDTSGSTGGRDGMFGGNPTMSNGNGSVQITGGTFIVTGASNMAQTFSNASQGVISVNIGNQTAGTEIHLTDENGNTILSYTPTEAYQVMILSSPKLVAGDAYTLQIGTQTYTVNSK